MMLLLAADWRRKEEGGPGCYGPGLKLTSLLPSVCAWWRLERTVSYTNLYYRGIVPGPEWSVPQQPDGAKQGEGHYEMRGMNS